MNVVYTDQENEWNDIINRFHDSDIYFSPEYAKSLEIHGDGKALLIYFKYNSVELCIPLFLKDIAENAKFEGSLPTKKYFDLSSPYGYGGPLIIGTSSEEFLNKFFEEMTNLFCQMNVVSVFLRYHPLLGNQVIFNKYFENVYIHNTIYIDVSDLDVYNNSQHSRNRYMIRKAKKNGVSIISDYGDRINDFKEIYNLTMHNNNAKDYYIFNNSYYDYLIQNCKDNIIFFYATFEDKIIAVAMFFYNDFVMHYHLSGLHNQYRYLGSMNLIIDQASRWAHQRGISKIHLGGGISNNDGLFMFKKQFNIYGEIPFYLGKKIIDLDAYNYLVDKRKELDESFNENNAYLIRYRME